MVQETGWQFLRERGVDLIAADSPAAFIDDTPTSKMIRQLLGVISEFRKRAWSPSWPAQGAASAPLPARKLKAERLRRRAARSRGARQGFATQEAQRGPDVVARHIGRARSSRPSQRTRQALQPELHRIDAGRRRAVTLTKDRKITNETWLKLQAGMDRKGDARLVEVSNCLARRSPRTRPKPGWRSAYVEIRKQRPPKPQSQPAQQRMAIRGPAELGLKVCRRANKLEKNSAPTSTREPQSTTRLLHTLPLRLRRCRRNVGLIFVRQ